MKIVDKIKSIFVKKKANIVDIVRPVGGYVVQSMSDVARVPQLPFQFSMCYDMFYHSDVLNTVVKALVSETFRNGLYVRPRFAKKCMVCGTEYQDDVDVCEVCGSSKFRIPSMAEKKRLLDWMDDVNYNDESLVDVLKAVDFDLNIVDNAFLVVTKRYYFGKDGYVIGSKPIEVLRGDPRYMRLIMNRYGRYAFTDEGKVLMFCLEHRDEVHEYSVEDVKEGRAVCSRCGKKMYPAYFVAQTPDGDIYYTNGEVLHFKKFAVGTGYGYPPVMAIWMKLFVLMKMDYFVLMSYHLQRPPKALLILRGNRDSIYKSWKVLEEYARNNPHMIYPLAVEDVEGGRRVAEFLDLTIKSNDINFIEYRNELRRSIGALYGIMPLFQADTSTGIGLANEGLQITVTNRVVETEQSIFNKKVLSWLTKQLGIKDWVIEVKPHEEKDLMSQLQRISMRIDIAMKMANLGYEPEMIETADGIDFRFKKMEKKPQEEVEYPEHGESSFDQRFEGELEHSKPKREEQRFEGEVVGIRRGLSEESDRETD